MQFSADFVVIGSHRADVLAAEREISRRMAADERGADDAGASPAPVAHRVHRRRRAHRRAPQLALR
jgi:hypothetical protein